MVPEGGGRGRHPEAEGVRSRHRRAGRSVNLSPEDVDDILRVLDSSDYDELHIDTGRFVLTLRREAGGWTTEHEVRAEPTCCPIRALDPACRTRGGEPT